MELSRYQFRLLKATLMLWLGVIAWLVTILLTFDMTGVLPRMLATCSFLLVLYPAGSIFSIRKQEKRRREQKCEGAAIRWARRAAGRSAPRALESRSRRCPIISGYTPNENSPRRGCRGLLLGEVEPRGIEPRS